jgi:hypothetical protein
MEIVNAEVQKEICFNCISFVVEDGTSRGKCGKALGQIGEFCHKWNHCKDFESKFTNGDISTKKELVIKIGFDTTSESVNDVTSLILGITNLANDEAMYVIDAKIDDILVFGDNGFSGQLRKRYWEW